MDLISREAVLDRIDKYIDKAQSTGTKDDFISFAELGVKALPSAFEGMTNGEVIKALFPNANYESCTNFMHITSPNICGVTFFWDFWNAPYKAESEDNED